MVLLRIRTKDGTERLQVPAGASATLGEVRLLIEAQFGVPVGEQALARSDPMGRQKGTALSSADDAKPLGELKISNGELLFLDYVMQRENQAQYVEKDPFNTQVKEGELRQQGKAQWTLSNFLDYRSTKEFVLGAPPEPHAKFVQIDQRATQTLMNYMILTGFAQKRVGWLYGRWVTDEATGEAGVQVHAIYEPKQGAPSADAPSRHAHARARHRCTPPLRTPTAPRHRRVPRAARHRRDVARHGARRAARRSRTCSVCARPRHAAPLSERRGLVAVARLQSARATRSACSTTPRARSGWPSWRRCCS
jgi:hypothetical protein